MHGADAAPNIFGSFLAGAAGATRAATDPPAPPLARWDTGPAAFG